VIRNAVDEAIAIAEADEIELLRSKRIRRAMR
jgi:hypothetical protein